MLYSFLVCVCVLCVFVCLCVWSSMDLKRCGGPVCQGGGITRNESFLSFFFLTERPQAEQDSRGFFFIPLGGAPQEAQWGVVGCVPLQGGSG